MDLFRALVLDSIKKQWFQIGFAYTGTQTHIADLDNLSMMFGKRNAEGLKREANDGPPGIGFFGKRNAADLDNLSMMFGKRTPSTFGHYYRNVFKTMGGKRGMDGQLARGL